jgi:hypothetical protein
MSLDVYLTLKGSNHVPESGIFIREDGQTKQITRAEWDERFPGREPVMVESQQGDEVFWANITHNLGEMASAAGIYKHLWRPSEIYISKAHQLIEPLRAGLERLEAEPDKFKQFNASNGWGTYETLVEFARNYLQACEQYPDADVSVSR